MSKNWSWKETGPGKYKNFLAQAIPDKSFETKWSDPVKLDSKRKVWYLFLLCPPRFEVFLIFPYFLRS